MSPLTILGCLNGGWSTTKRHYGVLLGIGFVYLVFSALGAIPFLGLLVTLILGPPLVAGYLYSGARAARGTVRFDNLFMGFNSFGSALGVYYLLVVMMMVLMAPYIFFAILLAVQTADGSEPSPSTIVGMITTFFGFGAIAAYFGTRFMWALPYCVDRRAGPIVALGASWRSTRGFMIFFKIAVIFFMLGLAIMGLSLVVTLLSIPLDNPILAIVIVYGAMILVGMPLSLSVFGHVYQSLFDDRLEEAAVFD